MSAFQVLNAEAKLWTLLRGGASIEYVLFLVASVLEDRVHVLKCLDVVLIDVCRARAL